MSKFERILESEINGQYIQMHQQIKSYGKNKFIKELLQNDNFNDYQKIELLKKVMRG